MWEIPITKITLFLTGIPIVVMAVLTSALDFCIVMVLQFSENTYPLSL